MSSHFKQIKLFEFMQVRQLRTEQVSQTPVFGFGIKPLEHSKQKLGLLEHLRQFETKHF